VIPILVLVGTIRNIISGRVKIAAISLDEIVSSKSKLNRNSLNCSTGLLNYSEKDSIYVYKVVCSEKDSKKDGHKVSIQILDDPTQVEDKKDLNIKVNCDCPAFLYQGGQYNLSQKDALLGNSRGKLVPPKVRDPVRVNYGCKHIFASVRKLLDKFKLDMPIKPQELQKPEEEEVSALPSSPFSEKKAPEKGVKPLFKNRAVSEIQTVPTTLLPKDIDTKAVEEMEEDVIPAVKGVPKLFKREEQEGEFSAFRPKQEPFEEFEAEEEAAPEEPENIPPSQKPEFDITPKHLDVEEDEDIEEAKSLRDKNRLNRQKKVKSLFGD